MSRRWVRTVAVLGGAGIAAALVALNLASATPDVAQLALSSPQVRIGASYLATATHFAPGEGVQFSWTGPTNGVMGTYAADSAGGTAHGPILEQDPPGDYTITATGQASGHVASAALRVLAANPIPAP